MTEEAAEKLKIRGGIAENIPWRLEPDIDLLTLAARHPEGTPIRALSKLRLWLSFSAACEVMP
jgi:hypothetical protein